jgi:nucleoside-diphosphate-sugar epimerase
MILVTGSTGLLGTHLLKSLCAQKPKTIKATFRSEKKKDYTISVLKTLLPKENHSQIDNIIWVKVDLLDIPKMDETLQDVLHIYHCAAWVGNASSDYTTMRKVNIKGTANLVNLALKHKIEKFCHVSSIATLGRYADDRLIDEEAPRETDNNRSVYSITKYGAEMEVWRATQEGLNAVILNPGIILGAGFFDSGSGLLFGKVLKNFKFYPPKHSGFVYVEDVVEAMLKAMQSSIVNERYILVGENLSFKTVMDYIAEAFDKSKPKFKLNKLMLSIAWVIQGFITIFKKLKTQLTKDTIMLINTKFKYDNSKSKKKLNLNYTRIEDAVKYIQKDYTLLTKNI